MSVLLVFLLAFAVAVMTIAMVAVVFVMRMALVIVRNFSELEQTDFLMFLVAAFAEIVFIHNAVRCEEYHDCGNRCQYYACQFHCCKGMIFFLWLDLINKTLIWATPVSMFLV